MWTVDGLVYWRIYASLGRNQLKGVCWLIFLTSIQFVERVPVMRQQSTINQIIKTMCPTTSHNSPEQTHGSLHRYATLLGLLHNINGLVQDCCISSALAMEILQSCNKPSIYCVYFGDRLFLRYTLMCPFLNGEETGIAMNSITGRKSEVIQAI